MCRCNCGILSVWQRSSASYRITVNIDFQTGGKRIEPAEVLGDSGVARRVLEVVKTFLGMSLTRTRADPCDWPKAENTSSYYHPDTSLRNSLKIVPTDKVTGHCWSGKSLAQISCTPVGNSHLHRFQPCFQQNKCIETNWARLKSKHIENEDKPKIQRLTINWVYSRWNWSISRLIPKATPKNQGHHKEPTC